VAQRLQRTLGDHVIADGPARDEFAVLITASHAAAVQAALTAAAEALTQQFWIRQALQINVVIGYAQVPRDAATPEELTRRANLALHSASRKTRGHVAAFKPDLETNFHERTFLTRELRRALAENALDVHYQPIVTASGAVIAGVEALLRWNHPTRGAIPPSVFVPVAEKTGLMPELGSFVLRRALSDAMRWPNIYMSVNLSPVQVRDRAFVDVAMDAIAEAGIEPARVMLEITEGVLIEAPEESKASLDLLRACGIKLALDDFGAGYSNLGYLQKYPIDKIKIDKSFVDPLGQSANGGVFIQAIVALGRALGVQVCAEGVETEQQRVLLRLAGCDEMQGYIFSKPVPREEIDRLLAEKPAETARVTARVAARA
jgi:predicted signal transduction protein with EAL and GGDEF domain